MLDVRAQAAQVFHCRYCFLDSDSGALCQDYKITTPECQVIMENCPSVLWCERVTGRDGGHNNQNKQILIKHQILHHTQLLFPCSNLLIVKYENLRLFTPNSLDFGSEIPCHGTVSPRGLAHRTGVHTEWRESVTKLLSINNEDDVWCIPITRLQREATRCEMTGPFYTRWLPCWCCQSRVSSRRRSQWTPDTAPPPPRGPLAPRPRTAGPGACNSAQVSRSQLSKNVTTLNSKHSYSLSSTLCSTVWTWWTMKPGQILSCYLVEDNVAVLGVNLVTHSLPGGPEPGDVGEVADVDGAVGAAQQPLPLHPRHSLILHPQALEAGVRV